MRTSLSAAPLHLSARGAVHEVGDLFQVDPPGEVHFAGVDLEDVVAGGVVGVGKLDFAVNAPWPQQRGVQDIDAVCCHQHLYTRRAIQNRGVHTEQIASAHSPAEPVRVVAGVLSLQVFVLASVLSLRVFVLEGHGRRVSSGPPDALYSAAPGAYASIACSSSWQSSDGVRAVKCTDAFHAQ